MVKSPVRVILTYPFTWVVVALPLVLIGAIVAWFDPPTGIKVLLGLLLLVSLAAWPLVMALSGVMEYERYRNARARGRTEIEPAALQAELRKLKDPRPLHQLKMLQNKRRNLGEVIEKRIDARDESFGRYVGVADKVYESTLHTLQEAAITFRNADAIDIDYITERLIVIGDDPADDAERASLHERQALHLKATQRGDSLLALIEPALTTLDRASNAMSDATVDGRLDDADKAMAELELLADVAAEFLAK